MLSKYLNAATTLQTHPTKKEPEILDMLHEADKKANRNNFKNFGSFGALNSAASSVTSSHEQIKPAAQKHQPSDIYQMMKPNDS